jgi:hypothetical protein
MMAQRLMSSPIRFLLKKWDDFFFKKQSPAPLGLFRIAYGLCVMATLLLLRPDWLEWYGSKGWISLRTMQTVEPGPRLTFFEIFPRTGPHADLWISALFWVSLLSAAMLSVGFLTRVNSVLTFLCLNSIQQRNLFMTQGGDTFLRVTGFFLMFAPAGAMFSLDRLLRLWRGKERCAVEPRSPWAQRMIQMELSLLYFCAACWKVKGSAWVQGTALFIVYHLNAMKRFPIPGWFYHPTVLKAGSWTTIVLEFTLGTLIWVKKLRYFVLTLGLGLHLWLEYSLNIPMFQWDVLTAYVLFIEPEDLARIWRKLAGISSEKNIVARPRSACAGTTGRVGSVN